MLRRLPPLLRRELLALVVLAVVAAGVWVFIAIAGEMMEGDTRALDARILLALRAPAAPAEPIGPHWLENATRDITALGSVTIVTIVTVISVAYLLVARKAGSALLVAVAVLGGILGMTLLKHGFDRPRPDIVPPLVEVHTQSFPSGHAMLSAIVYLALGALLAEAQERRRVGAYILAVAVLLVLLIGATRIYLGVHWPSDVLAGWCAGASWALLCWLVAYRLRRRRQLDEPAADDRGPT